MKAKITAFIDQLLIYDYALFGAVILLFILFLILSILLRKKIGLSIVLILLSFATLILGPTLGYIELHKFLFKTTTKLTEVKTLEFSQAIVIKGDVTNASKQNLSTCKITANIFKVSKNEYLNMLYPLNPFKKMSIFRDVNLSKNENYEFKMIVEPFTYSKDYNVSIGAKCR
ncbi:MAG: DUF2393 family protein [Campylobacterota bacterium]|nr:DUF2393 family protein [Campylobacterota bacterium]